MWFCWCYLKMLGVFLFCFSPWFILSSCFYSLPRKKKCLHLNWIKNTQAKAQLSIKFSSLLDAHFCFIFFLHIVFFFFFNSLSGALSLWSLSVSVLRRSHDLKHFRMFSACVLASLLFSNKVSFESERTRCKDQLIPHFCASVWRWFGLLQLKRKRPTVHHWQAELRAACFSPNIAPLSLLLRHLSPYTFHCSSRQRQLLTTCKNDAWFLLRLSFSPFYILPPLWRMSLESGLSDSELSVV